MSDVLVYSSLFGIALVAATLIPLQSEAALIALLATGNYPPAFLILAASAGNVAGSAINWALGRWLTRFSDRKWFPVSPETLEKASGWYKRYGRWSLLLSWAPIIGDPLTVAAGMLREPFASFLGIVSLAKTTRYCVLAFITIQAMG